jgi:acetylornithine/succinyldiaminopimelate/putrescine aminotransferase
LGWAHLVTGSATCAVEKGARLLHALSEMAGRYELVKDVRGKGLMIGVEFGMPQSWKLKASWKAARIAPEKLMLLQDATGRRRISSFQEPTVWAFILYKSEECHDRGRLLSEACRGLRLCGA